jgi:uncharacterized protein YodC (DUF2158 family)
MVTERSKRKPISVKQKLAAHSFQVGDVVMLNSGGPHMTITQKCSKTFCQLVWMRDSESCIVCVPFEALSLVRRRNAST